MYPESQGGKGTFSDADIRNLMTSDDKLKMLRSGDTNYLLTKTAELERMRKRQIADADPQEQHIKEQALEREVTALYNEVLAATEGTHAMKLEAAARAVASRYYLGYYQGAGDLLKRANR